MSANKPYTDAQRVHLLGIAEHADALIGDLAREIADYPVGSFKQDMGEALSGDPLVPFTVREVLDAIRNWLAMWETRRTAVQDVAGRS